MQYSKNITATDGKPYDTKFYNLDVIITELIYSYSLIQFEFSGCKGTEDIPATTSCA